MKITHNAEHTARTTSTKTRVLIDFCDRAVKTLRRDSEHVKNRMRNMYTHGGRLAGQAGVIARPDAISVLFVGANTPVLMPDTITD